MAVWSERLARLGMLPGVVPLRVVAAKPSANETLRKAA
jgi:hypothetical protein